jgi:hypothetical protein
MPRVRQRKLRPKTISSQGLSGQRGVNLIERILLEMGSRWTPSGPNEVGIDGYIELFDPSSRRPLGLTLAAQSKVVEAAGNESQPSFDYWCDANDLEYWLAGNTPIILVVSAPSSNVAYWISIKDYFRRWTPADSTRITFTRGRHRFTKDSFRELVSIAAPEQGLFLAPARRPETLQSNLLLLEEFPQQIFIAITDCRTYREAWARLRNQSREADAAWVLWEKKILSFHDVGESPWTSICDEGTVEPLPTTDWSDSEDADKQRLFVQLLNASLKAQLRPEVRYWPREDCYAVVGKPRKSSYQSLKRSSRISVVSRFESVAQDGRRFEWFRHLAFRGQFRRLDRQWYLEITPTYRFTSDGQTADRFHEERLKGIKRIEKNRAVLSSVLFWAYYLRPKGTLLRSHESILTFGKLATFSCDVGIDDQAWLAVDPESAPGAEGEGEEPFLPGLDNGRE